MLAMLDRALLIASGGAARSDDVAHARRVLELADGVRMSAARQEPIEIGPSAT